MLQNPLQKLDKGIVSQLPAMVAQASSLQIGGAKRIQFDREDISTLLVKDFLTEEVVVLKHCHMRMISFMETKTWYNDSSYVPDKEKGEESYICVVLLWDGNRYHFTTMLLRSSLCTIAAHVKQQLTGVLEGMHSSRLGDFEKQAYLFMPFRPEFKLKSTTAGAYIFVKNVVFLTPSADEINSAVAAFSDPDLAAEYNSAVEHAKKFLIQ